MIYAYPLISLLMFVTRLLQFNQRMVGEELVPTMKVIHTSAEYALTSNNLESYVISVNNQGRYITGSAGF